MCSGSRTLIRNILCSSFSGRAKPLMMLTGRQSRAVGYHQLASFTQNYVTNTRHLLSSEPRLRSGNQPQKSSLSFSTEEGALMRTDTQEVDLLTAEAAQRPSGFTLFMFTDCPCCYVTMFDLFSTHDSYFLCVHPKEGCLVCSVCVCGCVCVCVCVSVTSPVSPAAQRCRCDVLSRR